MKKYRVVLADYIDDSMEPEREVLGDMADLICRDAQAGSDLIGDEADALLVFHKIKVTRELLASLPNCKIIARCGVGFDNVDLKAARENGIDVVNIPDYGTEEVADSAIGLALSLARGINRFNRHFQRPGDRVWSHTACAPVYRLRGRTFGVVGLGRIGTATAMRAKSLGMRVVFYDPYVADGTDKALGIERAESFESILRESFILSFHVPNTAETYKMLNENTLALMQPGAFIVNTARGDVVDTKAIPTAIESGQLAGAAIDVLSVEPPPNDDPLLMAWRDENHPAHERLIVNPHVAFYSEEGANEMRLKAAKACRARFLNEPLRNIVNP